MFDDMLNPNLAFSKQPFTFYGLACISFSLQVYLHQSMPILKIPTIFSFYYPMLPGLTRTNLFWIYPTRIWPAFSSPDTKHVKWAVIFVVIQQITGYKYDISKSATFIISKSKWDWKFGMTFHVVMWKKVKTSCTFISGHSPEENRQKMVRVW